MGRGAGTGTTPGTVGVRQTTDGSLFARLPALIILLLSTPTMTLLDISSIFICRLFIQNVFLPVVFATQS